MPIPVPIALAAAFAAVSLAVLALQSYVAERRSLSRSLRNVESMDLGPTDLRRQELAQPLMRRVVLPGLRRVGHRLRRFTPASVLERLDQELVQAGSPAGWDGERILAIKVILAFGLALSSIIVGPALGLQTVQVILLPPFLGFLGYYAPEWFVRSRSAARGAQVQRALPDALDLLSITVQAGLGFDAAVQSVSSRIGGPLGDELFRVIQEMRLGKARSEALRDLGNRTDLAELRSFVLAMVQADIFGISIGQVLHVQAREMRIKRRQRAEEQAQKIPVKIVVPLIFCIFPALFVVILGPAVLTVYEQLLSR